MNNILAKIEALLFIYGEPIKIKKLAEFLDASEENTASALKDFAEKLLSGERGLNLLIGNGETQLVTKPDLAKIVANAIRQELDSDLTPAALEALSVIAYLGPCGRAEVDYIRGVNSAFILQSLAIRGLISKKSNPNRSNGYLYQITFDFLKHIGINSPEELVDYQKYRALDKLFKKEETTDEQPPVENH